MQNKIKEIVALAIGSDPNTLPNDAEMGNPSAWDSFAQLSIIIALEQEFSLTISPDEGASLLSLSAIEAFVGKSGKSTS